MCLTAFGRGKMLQQLLQFMEAYFGKWSLTLRALRTRRSLGLDFIFFGSNLS
jgi:hypothetical protein